MPKNAKNLTLSSRLKVELVFNQPIDTDSMVDSYNSLHYLCYDFGASKDSSLMTKDGSVKE